MFEEAGTVLNAQQKTSRVMIHGHSFVVERRGKGVVDVGGAGVGLGVSGSGGEGVGRFGANCGARVRFDALLDEFFAGK